MSHTFKVGDKAKFTAVGWNKLSGECSTHGRVERGQVVFSHVILTSIADGYPRWEAYDIHGNMYDQCSGHHVRIDDFIPLDLVISNPLKNMSLKSMYRNLFLKEPEKSFLKAGVINENNELTADGKDLFQEFLFEKNKEAFNTEVVQPIIKELDKENK